VDGGLRQRIERLLGARIVEAERVLRGYTPAQRWLVRLEDRRSAFVKAAVNELTADWLRREHAIYTAVEADFLPTLLGWDDDEERPVLVLEYLAAGHWPPPWRSGDVANVLATLERVHAHEPPPAVPPLAEDLTADGWRRIAANPAPFRSTGLSTDGWLESALPTLLDAEAAFRLEGEALVHTDVRSDNLCLRAGGAILVDWNHAARGNPELDVAFWLPSLEHEGGPPPEATLPAAREAAAVVSGYFAARAGLPPVPDAPGVRPIQLAQLGPALRWVSRALELPPVGGR
jgi:hypothetical protein